MRMGEVNIWKMEREEVRWLCAVLGPRRPLSTTRTRTQNQRMHISGELMPKFGVLERQQEVAATRAGLEARARSLDEKEQGLLFLEVQLEETSVELERREIALGMSGRCNNRLVFSSGRARVRDDFVVLLSVIAEMPVPGCANGSETEAADKLAQL